MMPNRPQLQYPSRFLLAQDRYRVAYATLEALRLKHNTKSAQSIGSEGLSCEARGFRRACLDAQRAIMNDVLLYRACLAAASKKRLSAEPNEESDRLKKEGQADCAAVNLKVVTGVDLDGEVVPIEAPPDPLEDFTAFEETDPNADITIAANQITVDTMNSNVDAYVYRNYGVGHFATTFEHLYDFKATAHSADSWTAFWAWSVTNVIQDASALWVAQSQAVGAEFMWTGAAGYYKFDLQQCEGQEADSGAQALTENVWYYCTAERTGDTALQWRIYSDSARTTLLETWAVSVPAGRAYQYLAPVLSGDYDINDTLSALIANLDIQEAGTTSGPHAYAF